MEDERLEQETTGAETDDFLSGWEEDEAAQEEASPEEDGGEQDTPPAEERGEEPGGEQAEGLETPPPARPPRDRGLVRSDIRAFMAAFPEAVRDFQNIPREVWAEVNAGSSLTAAYARYAGAQEAARIQAREAAARRERQNTRNAAASTGSMRSAGGNGPRDPFLEGWNEG